MGKGICSIHKQTKALLSAAMALVYFFSSVAALHATEIGFWDSRRQSAKRVRGETNPLSSLATGGQSLLTQLPPAVPVGWGGENASFEIGPKTGDWLGKLVMPYGHVSDVYVSPTPNAPMVVHIQDAHGIGEAQKNISAMVGVLQSERHINLVGLEGASGSFSVEPLRHIASPVVTEAVAKFFLEKGLIAGPEFAGLTLPHPTIFFGIEDNDLYTANIQALKDAFKNKTALLPVLNTLNGEAGLLKKTIFSDPLNTFDHHFEAYKAEREKLGDYVRYLVKQTPRLSPLSSGQGEGNFPNIHLLVKAFDHEDGLDFKEVESERRRLVEVLIRRLPKMDIEELVAKSVDYRAGRLAYGDYNRYLRTLCANHKIRMADYPQFHQYINYVLLADQIKSNELISEMDQLETAVQDSLAKTAEERTLMEVARDLAMVTKLLNHELAVTDWFKYEKRRPEILNLESRLASLAGGAKSTSRSLSALTAEALKPFEDFCSFAVQRNNALAGNLLDHMSTSKMYAGVLVAGGFHTAGLTHIWREKQVSYVVVTPKISKVPTDNNYLDILARDPVPLEKLLAGDRIFLVHPVNLVGGEVRNFLHQLLLRLSAGTENPTKDEIESAAQETLKHMNDKSFFERLNAAWDALIAFIKGVISFVVKFVWSEKMKGKGEDSPPPTLSGSRPNNSFQSIHARLDLIQDRSFLPNVVHKLTHPVYGGPALETVGLWTGFNAVSKAFSYFNVGDPAWVISALQALGLTDPTGSVFLTSIFVAVIFSLVHPDLWDKATYTDRKLTLNEFVSVFSQRFFFGLFFLYLLPSSGSVDISVIGLSVGFSPESFFVHGFLNLLILSGLTKKSSVNWVRNLRLLSFFEDLHSAGKLKRTSKPDFHLGSGSFFNAWSIQIEGLRFVIKRIKEKVGDNSQYTLDDNQRKEAARLIFYFTSLIRETVNNAMAPSASIASTNEIPGNMGHSFEAPVKIPVEMVLPEQGVERINDIGSILKLLPPFKIIDKRQIYSQFRFPFEKFIRSEVIPPMILDEDTILMPFVGGKSFGGLSDSAKVRANEQMESARKAAKTALGMVNGETSIEIGGWRIVVDSNKANFRFDEEGNVTAWFDPIAPWPPKETKEKPFTVPVIDDNKFKQIFGLPGIFDGAHNIPKGKNIPGDALGGVKGNFNWSFLEFPSIQNKVVLGGRFTRMIRMFFNLGDSKKIPYGVFGISVGLLSSLAFFLLGVFGAIPVAQAVEAVLWSVVGSSLLIVGSIGYGLLLGRLGNRNLAPMPFGESDQSNRAYVETYLSQNFGIQVGPNNVFRRVELFDQKEEVVDDTLSPGTILFHNGSELRVSVRNRTIGLVAPIFLGQVHFGARSGTLYVKRSLAREPSILLGLGVAHIMGKEKVGGFWIPPFMRDIAREVMGNLYELGLILSPIYRHLVESSQIPLPRRVHGLTQYPATLLQVVNRIIEVVAIAVLGFVSLAILTAYIIISAAFLGILNPSPDSVKSTPPVVAEERISAEVTPEAKEITTPVVKKQIPKKEKTILPQVTELEPPSIVFSQEGQDPVPYNDFLKWVRQFMDPNIPDDHREALVDHLLKENGISPEEARLNGVKPKEFKLPGLRDNNGRPVFFKTPLPAATNWRSYSIGYALFLFTGGIIGAFFGLDFATLQAHSVASVLVALVLFPVSMPITSILPVGAPLLETRALHKTGNTEEDLKNWALSHWGVKENSERYNELVAAGRSFLAARKAAEDMGLSGLWAEIKAHSLWNFKSYLNKKTTGVFLQSAPTGAQNEEVQSLANERGTVDKNFILTPTATREETTVGRIIETLTESNGKIDRFSSEFTSLRDDDEEALRKLNNSLWNLHLELKKNIRESWDQLDVDERLEISRIHQRAIYKIRSLMDRIEIRLFELNPPSTIGANLVWHRGDNESRDFDWVQELQAGDVVMVKGLGMVSAFFSNLGEAPMYFSHVGIVHVTEDGTKHIVEALDPGLIVTPIDKKIDAWKTEKRVRFLVLRHRDQSLALNAGKIIYDLATNYSEGAGNPAHPEKNLPFNPTHSLFMEAVSYSQLKELTINNNKGSDGEWKYRLLCVDAVISAFRWSAEKLLVDGKNIPNVSADVRNPELAKRFDDGNNTYLAMDYFESFPGFDVVAEGRDLKLLETSMTEDYVINHILNWVKKNASRINWQRDWIDTTLGIVKSVLANLIGINQLLDRKLFPIMLVPAGLISLIAHLSIPFTRLNHTLSRGGALSQNISNRIWPRLNRDGHSSANNIVYRVLLAIGVSRQVAAKWGMRSLPLEIGGIGLAGLLSPDVGASLFAAVLPLLDPTFLGLIVLAGGLFFFALLHVALQFYEYKMGRGVPPALRGFARQFNYFSPYLLLPLSGGAFLLVFALAAGIHYSYDNRVIKAEVAARAVMDSLRPTANPGAASTFGTVTWETMAQKAAFEILLNTLMGGEAGKELPDHLSARLDKPGYWNDPVIESELVLSLSAPAARKRLEQVSQKLESLSESASLIGEGLSTTNWMTVVLAGYDGESNENKKAALTSARGLLSAQQRLLVVLESEAEMDRMKNHLATAINIAANSPLIWFHVRKPGQTMNDIRDEVNAETHQPLSSIVLMWKEDRVFLGEEFSARTFGHVAATIQNELNKLIAIIHSA